MADHKPTERLDVITLDELIERAGPLGIDSAAEVEAIADRAVREGRATKLIRGTSIRYGLTPEAES